jgi:dipeptidyl aminopeptidase/acylaminoacyl peptidase
MGGCSCAERGGGDDAEASPPGTRRGMFASTIRRWGIVAAAAALALTAAACQRSSRAKPAAPPNVQPFNFEVVLGPNHYQIEGYVVRSTDPGRLPAVLILNGGEGDARRCVAQNADLASILEIQVACLSIPGYGRSSGPSRLVGPQAVAAARHALDLLAQRPDVDPSRLAVWGVADGAVAAGLLMDSDKRPKSLILQSGAYDMLKLWPEAPLRTKLHMLHEVWPSKRVLKERSVIENLPTRLDCNVLIVHGERDKRTPVKQAMKLADELRARGAHVTTAYFPTANHDIGAQAKQPVKQFLRETLSEHPPAPTS